jgi:hypothetical protein
MQRLLYKGPSKDYSTVTDSPAPDCNDWQHWQYEGEYFANAYKLHARWRYPQTGCSCTPMLLQDRSYLVHSATVFVYRLLQVLCCTVERPCRAGNEIGLVIQYLNSLRCLRHGWRYLAGGVIGSSNCGAQWCAAVSSCTTLYHVQWLTLIFFGAYIGRFARSCQVLPGLPLTSQFADPRRHFLQYTSHMRVSFQRKHCTI